MLQELSVAEQRYQAVLAVIEDGLSVVEAAAKVGVSRQTLHAWLSRYAEGGLEGLVDRSHRPKVCPHQMSPQVEQRLVELRGLHPAWGADRLRYRLDREGLDPLPSRAAIGRALVRLGLIRAGQRRTPPRSYRRWERSRPMELWQMDVMGAVLLDDGTDLKAVTGIDDHSRFVVCVGLVERATSRAVCGVLVRALATHGVPEEILTDNGKVFTGRYALRPIEVLFDKICRENGIKHRLTAPRSPTTTGKIERFHGTLRRELLDARTFPDKGAAQKAIDAFVQEYNHDRPHQGADRRPPAVRFAGARPDPGPALDTTAFDEATTVRDGPEWVTRRAGANGVICVGYQQLSVGKHRAGQVIDVHVSDQLLQAWSGNDLVRTVVRTDKGGTIRKKRAARPAP